MIYPFFPRKVLLVTYYIPGSMLVIGEIIMTINNFPNWKIPLYECKKVISSIPQSHEGQKT